MVMPGNQSSAASSCSVGMDSRPSLEPAKVARTMCLVVVGIPLAATAFGVAGKKRMTGVPAVAEAVANRKGLVVVSVGKQPSATLYSL